jgi:hypothetical protein
MCASRIDAPSAYQSFHCSSSRLRCSNLESLRSEALFVRLNEVHTIRLAVLEHAFITRLASLGACMLPCRDSGERPSRLSRSSPEELETGIFANCLRAGVDHEQSSLSNIVNDSRTLTVCASRVECLRLRH